MLSHSPNVTSVTRIGWRPALMAMSSDGHMAYAKVVQTPGVTGYLSFEASDETHHDVITEYKDADRYYRPQRPA